MKALVSVLRLFCIGILACCGLTQYAAGQLTARGANGKAITAYTNLYGNRDTIFVYNQTPQPQTGTLSLQRAGINTFKWYRFDYTAQKFESQAFATTVNTAATTQANLAQGGYKVTVTPQNAVAPRDSFVAWLYMNPGFNFKLYKDNKGEVIYDYKTCEYTDFPLDPATPTVQSSFTYYNPNRPVTQTALRLDNKLTFTIKPGNGQETVTALNTQGKEQYLRGYQPPYEDTRYYFRAYDMFGIEKKDDIMYLTIIPYLVVSQPVLPEVDPTSAPVPVKFTYQKYNTKDYLWRFGDGDSVMYDLEKLPPDTVKHTYYTPKKAGYQVVVTVVSAWGCTYTTVPVKVVVDDPLLQTSNVFTPNGDNRNDYFKPYSVSLRNFEISIYTRTGRRVYHYKGSDLRDWKGWDGRIENTGKDAAEGVYFFVMTADGWDEPPTKFNEKSEAPRGPYGGSFHLYR